MNDWTIALECHQREFCSNCSVRQNCDIRKIFYDDKKYNITMQEIVIYFLLSVATGDDQERVITVVISFLLLMQKKRQRELAEHPEYSPE